jgi:cell division protein FtsW (lipid II flippase)
MAWGNALRRAFRPSRADAGPKGVAIKVKTHNVPGAEESGRALPGPIWWALLVAIVFYVLAHFSIIVGVWPVHGTSPGAGGTLMRDGLALVAWLLVLFMLRRMKYRGTWGIVVFPILIFLLSRPAQFQAFTDPSYQARGPARAQANDLKATRSRLSTIERTYSEERQQVVYQGPPPPLPDPFAQAVRQETRGFVAKSTTYLPVFLAPLLVLVGFALTRGRYLTRWLRERRVFVFAPAILAFFVMAAFVNPATGKLAGTTPWELLLPVFVGIWAAFLADDAYNLGQPGQVFNRRRLAQLFAYGALPIIPFLYIHELGLTIVLASSLAAMLLVGTRRGWWGALLMTVWAAMVVVVFNLDERSSTRYQLAYDPYKDLSGMTEEQAQHWADKLHQIKLFDANYLTGGLLGEGPGRGHGETAPNAADDGFFTLVAAQWGWAGTVALVLVYTLFLVELLSAAVRERGAFERTMITGLAMLIGVPFWLAALGDARVIPLTGVAAAFAAHGGAKLLASALAVGVIAGISHRHREDERLEQALAPPTTDASQGVRIR